MSDSTEATFEETRQVLHRVAAHVLGRRRFDVSGRFGLRISPGGISTPIFGTDGECVRTAGTMLIREAQGVAAITPIPGATLRSLAEFAGADIDTAFSVGTDTPPIGDPDRPLELDAHHVESVAEWYRLGWVALDTVLGEMPATAVPPPLQLWPEHFDVGTNVTLPGGDRVNLGCSPGDSYLQEPYLYVGPWEAARPGDPAYWNTPFGAALRMSVATASGMPVEAAAQFLRTGIAVLSGTDAP